MADSEGGGDDLVLKEAARRIAQTTGVPSEHVTMTRMNGGAEVRIRGLDPFQFEEVTDTLVLAGIGCNFVPPCVGFVIDKTPEQIMELFPAIGMERRPNT